jgi:hypothetical protein
VRGRIDEPDARAAGKFGRLFPNTLSPDLPCSTTAPSSDVDATELTTLQFSTSRVRASEHHAPLGPLAFHKYSSVTMRKPDTALTAARNPPQSAKYRGTPEELVCIALLFAMFAIAFRIVSVW